MIRTVSISLALVLFFLQDKASFVVSLSVSLSPSFAYNASERREQLSKGTSDDDDDDARESNHID